MNPIPFQPLIGRSVPPHMRERRDRCCSRHRTRIRSDPGHQSVGIGTLPFDSVTPVGRIVGEVADRLDPRPCGGLLLPRGSHQAVLTRVASAAGGLSLAPTRLAHSDRGNWRAPKRSRPSACDRRGRACCIWHRRFSVRPGHTAPFMTSGSPTLGMRAARRCASGARLRDARAAGDGERSRAGLVLFTAGSVLWTSWVQFFNPVPYPSISDACFLAFFFMAFPGSACWCARPSPRLREPSGWTP